MLEYTILPHTPRPTKPVQAPITAYYWSGDAIRSRLVSDLVLTGTVEVPAPPARLMADWQRDIADQLRLAPGEVEALPLARARMRWPDFKSCVHAMVDWTGSMGLGDVLAISEVALMASRGAKYHHDGVQYGGMAFCNLFLSEDQGLDLHFPALGIRIPLTRGTAVIFDTGQPHAVIRRGAHGFDAADFSAGQDCTQVFLTWELPVEDVKVTQALGIALDIAPTPNISITEEQIWRNGRRADVCPNTGRWQ